MVHVAKDIGGLILNGEASLGIAQVQMATAAFLDTNPDPASLTGISHEEFERRKGEALDALTPEQKLELIGRLLDPETNLAYAAEYLGLIRDVTGADPYTTEGAQSILANYNRGPDNWYEPPHDYGKAYGQYMDFIILLLP